MRGTCGAVYKRIRTGALQTLCGNLTCKINANRAAAAVCLGSLVSKKPGGKRGCELGAGQK